MKSLTIFKTNHYLRIDPVNPGRFFRSCLRRRRHLRPRENRNPPGNDPGTPGI
ncbi:Uncharacterized protein dnl_39510 [Desulfonema limicola]|uniref:Uncharacterized protein n=1 Tax=Desulfonema limicola TaxID=45656 RepID=A0A975GHN8_9BACT|nr:Uncharacterized protein dnl_39510 [Desulfonema limicola]